MVKYSLGFPAHLYPSFIYIEPTSVKNEPATEVIEEPVQNAPASDPEPDALSVPQPPTDLKEE